MEPKSDYGPAIAIIGFFILLFIMLMMGERVWPFEK